MSDDKTSENTREIFCGFHLLAALPCQAAALAANLSSVHIDIE